MALGWTNPPVHDTKALVRAPYRYPHPRHGTPLQWTRRHPQAPLRRISHARHDQDALARGGSSGVCYPGAVRFLDRSRNGQIRRAPRRREATRHRLSTSRRGEVARLVRVEHLKRSQTEWISQRNTPRLVKAISERGILGSKPRDCNLKGHGNRDWNQGAKEPMQLEPGLDTGAQGTGTHPSIMVVGALHLSTPLARHLTPGRREARGTQRWCYRDSAVSRGGGPAPPKGPSIHPKVVRQPDESVRAGVRPADLGRAGRAVLFTNKFENFRIFGSRTSRTSRTFGNVREHSGRSTHHCRHIAHHTSNACSCGCRGPWGPGTWWLVFKARTSKTRSKILWRRLIPCLRYMS